MTIDQSISKHQATDTSKWNIMKREICSLKVNLWYISAVDLHQDNIHSHFVLRLSKVGLPASNILH